MSHLKSKVITTYKKPKKILSHLKLLKRMLLSQTNQKLMRREIQKVHLTV